VFVDVACRECHIYSCGMCSERIVRELLRVRILSGSEHGERCAEDGLSSTSNTDTCRAKLRPAGDLLGWSEPHRCGREGGGMRKGPITNSRIDDLCEARDEKSARHSEEAMGWRG
jgi:hypothetical protein